MSMREKGQATGISRTFEQNCQLQRSMQLVETVYRLSIQLSASEQRVSFRKCVVRPFQFRQILPKDTAGKQQENIITTFQLAVVHYWS